MSAPDAQSEPQKTQLASVADIVAALGGSTKFGTVCGFTINPASRGSDMLQRGSIPVRYWSAVIEAARAQGFDLDEAALVRIHADKVPS